MKIEIGFSIAMIAIAAVCTFFTRLVPFLFFGHGKKPPKMITYLGKVLPLAILASLIIYCLQGTDFSQPTSFAPQLISIAVTVCLHLIFKNVFVSIGGGTACYMLLLAFVF